MTPTLTIEDFELIAQEVFDALPPSIQSTVENVHIVVEEIPSDEVVSRMKLSSDRTLLGLYEGIPLTNRGTFYGASPVVPDKITLFKRNIELHAQSEKEIRKKIQDVLIHEIAHHYGMNEEQVRNAGY